MATTYQPSQWLVPENSNTDKVGNYSFDLDGVGDYIDIGSPLIGIGAYTISFWINPTTVNDDDRIMSNIDTDNFGIRFWGGNIQVWGKTNGSAAWTTFLTSFSIDTWYHIVIVHDGAGTVTGYKDGVVDTPITSEPDLSNIGLGAKFNLLFGNNYDGKISEVSIFNYALTEGNVHTLYGAIPPATPTNGVGNPMGLTPVPVGYWKGDKAALGAQWAVPNQVSKDYVFETDGSSGPIINTPSVNLGTTNTVSFWYYNEAWKTWQMVLGSSTNQYDYLIAISTAFSPTINHVYVNIGDPSAYLDFTSTAVRNILTVTNTWLHIAIVRSGDSVELYINGDLVETLTGVGAINDTIFDTLMAEGDGVASNSINGKMSNVAVWDSALTSGNITTIYNNGTPTDLTSLSPVSWWKLDDSATFSTNWSIPDDGSASNTGTSSGMTQGNLVPDTVTRGTAMYSEYSFEFDGVDDYIQIASAMSTSSTDWSIQLWFKTSQGGGNKIFVGQPGDKYFGGNWGKFCFISSDNSFDITSVLTITDGNWHHGVFTYNYTSGAWKLYIDNALDTSQTATSGINIPPWNIFGARTTSQYFAECSLDEIAYWNIELSAANVTTLYNNGRPADLASFSPAPIAWWKLGEEAFSTDPAADPNGWTIPDQIGSNDGTSAGNPDLVGDAPQSFANGLSDSMDIDDRIGESGFSDNNALSYNMDSEARVEDVPA